MNRVRIIGGRWRSRILTFPDSPDLRPTPDRVRETLFNWLGQDLTGKTCLDLFAGSGALGFEAASRGAARVVMVEANRQVFRALQASAEKLPAPNVELVCADGVKFPFSDRRAFDVVFLDPPFRLGLPPKLLHELPGHLAAGGYVYVEAAQPIEVGSGWQAWRAARAGNVHYQLLIWNPDE